MKVLFYVWDLKRDPNLENYPYGNFGAIEEFWTLRWVCSTFSPVPSMVARTASNTNIGKMDADTKPSALSPKS